MRKWLLAAALVLFTVSGTAQSGINAKIAESCPADYEPVISMAAPNDTYSHPAAPGFYEHELCVQGIREASVSDSCGKNAGFYIHSNNTEYAHFSDSEAYNIPVCVDRMVTQVRDSCMDNQTALMSVSNEHNAHVAWPGVLEKELCGFFQEPENVTLNMEFNLSSSDTVYSDDEEIGEESIRIAGFPYIVSEGNGLVAGIVADDMIKVERRIDRKNVLSMKRSEGEFIVPFTEGDHANIERMEESVLGKEFLESLSPSFGFYMPESPTVRAGLDPRDISIKSGLSIRQGSHTLEITKTGEDEITIEKEGQ